jgi:hypothetical protein
MKAASVYFDVMNRYFGVIVRVTTSCYNTSCEIIADQFYIHCHTGFKNGKSPSTIDDNDGVYVGKIALVRDSAPLFAQVCFYFYFTID